MNSDSIWAIGCMSGTSIDGIDAAALRTDGVRIEEFGTTEFRPYTVAERNTIRTAFGEMPGSQATVAASAVVTDAHLQILQRFGFDAVIGFHGQTLSHHPESGKTHQTGSAMQLAKQLNRIVIADFRTKDMEEGGQGAPLAPFYHFALARHYLRFKKPVLFLNLGGLANLSFVDPRSEAAESPSALLAFDTGPANAPINDLVLEAFADPFDRDGKLAAAGAISGAIVDEFLSDPYFELAPPKSLDRNHFARLSQMVRQLDIKDGAATLTACVAQSIKAGLIHLPVVPELMLVCGGGRANATLMDMLSDTIPAKISTTDQFGIDGDMLEAQAFAYLAVRVLYNLPTSSPTTTGCRQPVLGGEVYRSSI